MNTTTRTRLVFVIHNHQPTGNFDKVFDSAADGCYEPFLGALEANPHVKAALHYTGPLLEWFEKHRPEVLARVRGLAERGQVEIVGGAWYEPMLSVLPDRDAIGQIRTMRHECARLFGRVPAGLWLAERVWDPDLPRILAEADVRWVLLDDTHFRYAGVQDEWVAGTYRTEKAGASVVVLPIAKQLRYAIPFRLAPETVDLLASRRGEVVTYGDDGEKFGVWPDTDVWVWKKGWLRDFLRLLGERADAIETVHPSAAAGDPSACRGRIYLPTASYYEMGEWSLPTPAGRRLMALKKRCEADGSWDEVSPFLRGGIWQNFLAKYPEANRLHKRMLRVSRKVDDALRRDPLYPRAIGPDAQRARLELYRGQCNCAYWHGLFGGLYLPHLRGAVHSHLVRADRMADPCTTPRLTVEDWDHDGRDEVILESSTLSVVVKPHVSGAIETLDARDQGCDLLDTLARRPEIYHDDVAAAVETARQAALRPKTDGIASIHDRVRKAEERLLALLRYDALPRLGLLDWVLPADVGFEAWNEERLPPCVEPARIAYRVLRADPAHPAETALRAEVDSPWGRLRLDKSLAVDSVSRALEARWTVDATPGAAPARVGFATELTLTVPEQPGAPRGFVFEEPPVGPEHPTELQSRGVVDGFRRARLAAEHHGFDVLLEASPAARLWRRPVETVSQSEEGFEAVFQGTNLLFLWPAGIAPGRPLSVSLRISVVRR
jgi:alpha-amylase